MVDGGSSSSKWPRVRSAIPKPSCCLLMGSTASSLTALTLLLALSLFALACNSTASQSPTIRDTTAPASRVRKKSFVS